MVNPRAVPIPLHILLINTLSYHHGRNAVYKESFWQFLKEQGYIKPRTVNRYTHIFPQYLLDSNDLTKDVEVGSDFQFVQSFDDKL